MTQLAITKTPVGHGTYCLRLRCQGGGSLEFGSLTPLTWDDLLAALEARMADIRMVQVAELAGGPPEGT